MISFHPDLKEVAMATNGEYIFVIDRSGIYSSFEILYDLCPNQIRIPNRKLLFNPYHANTESD